MHEQHGDSEPILIRYTEAELEILEDGVTSHTEIEDRKLREIIDKFAERTRSSLSTDTR